MRRVNRMTKRLGFAFLLAAVCAAPAGESDLCLVEAVAYPGKDYYMWDGLYAARNGAVYTGLITEGITSSFYVYRPEERRNTLLFDLAAFLGERGKGVRTASKIHHRPVEDDEGNLYFVPMNNGAGPRSIDYTSWEGGHWMKFDPRSGRLEKMGLVDQGIGCYPLTLDPKRGYLFGVGFTGYFYRFDLKTRVTRNFGRVANWDVCRDIFCDDRGNVYGCFPVGRVWKYDAESEQVVDLAVRLPHDPTAFPAQLGNPMLDRTYDWRAIEWDPVRKVAYGVTCGSGSILFRYDPHAGREGEVTPLAKLCHGAFLDRRDAPYSTLAFALDSERQRIFFAPSAREYTLGGYVETFGNARRHHLIEYDLRKGKRIDRGMLQTRDGRRVFGCEAASVGPDGTLYLCGEVEVRDPKEATAQVGEVPVALQLILFRPQEGGES